MVFTSLCNQENLNSLNTLSSNLNSLSNTTLSIPQLTPRPIGRKIGILAWGSLVNDPRDLKIADAFKKAPLKLRIQLSRLSGKGTDKQRLTRIIDPILGQEISLWHTVSVYNKLPEARENLKIREGTTSQNIFYIKTLLPGQIPDNNERVIKDWDNNTMKDGHGDSWYILDSAEKQLGIIDRVNLSQWASREQYNAVIWTRLGKTQGYDSMSKLKTALNNVQTLTNTKAYIKNLPDQNELTEFEKNIMTNQF